MHEVPEVLEKNGPLGVTASPPSILFPAEPEFLGSDPGPGNLKQVASSLVLNRLVKDTVNVEKQEILIQCVHTGKKRPSDAPSSSSGF